MNGQSFSGWDFIWQIVWRIMDLMSIVNITKTAIDQKLYGGRRFNYPDIIVHKRESNKSNLLIVEVKTPNDTQSAHFQTDFDKLRGFIREVPYSYKYGVHVYISASSCSLVWYARGEIPKYVKYKVDRNTHTLLQVDPNILQNQTAFDRWYIDKWDNILE